jgi:nucleoside recognition membrane protein YjiH
MKMFQLVTTALTIYFVFAILAPAFARAEKASPGRQKPRHESTLKLLEVLGRMSTTVMRVVFRVNGTAFLGGMLSAASPKARWNCSMH